MRSFRGFAVVLIGLMVIGVGCLEQDQPENVGPTTSPSTVTVEGSVSAIDDQTPVDGGVTITLRRAASGEVLLLFPSLFTSPPPSKETLELYKVVAQVEVEDHIRVTGTQTDRGIVIEDLTILKTE